MNHPPGSVFFGEKVCTGNLAATHRLKSAGDADTPHKAHLLCNEDYFAGMPMDKKLTPRNQDIDPGQQRRNTRVKAENRQFGRPKAPHGIEISSSKGLVEAGIRCLERAGHLTNILNQRLYG